MDRPKKKTFFLSLAHLLLTIGLVGVASGATEPASPARHPSYRELTKEPDPSKPAWDKLKFSDSKGRDFSLNEFRGKLLLVSFFFTSCPDICPPQTAGLVKTWEKLGKQEQNDISFVSISIDSKNDDTAKLADYRKRFHIKTENWIFARGSEENVKLLGDHFGSLGNAKNPMEHRGRVYLVDPQGRYLLSFASPPAVDSVHLAKELTAASQTFVR